MKCDELEKFDAASNADLSAGYNHRYAYEADEVDSAIAELKDKCQMHDFFWEGCGFAKRGFKNTIAVSDAFDRLEAENAELKAKLETVNELVKTARQMLDDAKASHYVESVDAGMSERRLRRTLWIARAEWARSSALSYHLIESHPDKDVSATYKRKANKWEKAKDKCLKKAEEYK